MASEQTDLATLVVKLEARQNQFERELAKAEKRSQQFGKKVQKDVTGVENAFDRMGATAAKAFAGLATAAAVRSIVNVTKATAQFADDLADMADKAGVGVERMQALIFAGERLGPNQEVLSKALAKLNTQLGEVAITGKGAAAETFERLGLSLRDVEGNVRSTESAFDEIMEKIDALGTTAEKNAALAKIFGEEAGPQMGLLLANGIRGLREMEEQARSLGIVINEDLIRTGAEFNDKWDAMWTSAERRFKTFVLYVIDAATSLDGWLKDNVALGTVQSVERSMAAVDGQIEASRARIEELKAMGRETRAEEGNLANLMQERDRLGMFAPKQARKAGAPVIPEPGAAGSGAASGGASRGSASRAEDPGAIILREVNAIYRRAEARTQELATIDLAASAQERYRMEFEAIQRLQDAGIEITDDVNRSITEAGESYEHSARAVDEYREALEKAKKAEEDAAEAAKERARAVDDALREAGDLIEGLVGKTLTWEQALVRVAEAALRIYTQEQKGGGNGLVSSLISGAGSLIGGLFGGGGVTPMGLPTIGSPQATGARASGGPVKAGNLYRVNEHGTEYFRPAMDGTVIPMGGGSGGKGGSAPVINLSTHVNVARAGAGPEEIARAVEAGNKRTLSQVPRVLAAHNARFA